ncbi:hypothetical protein GDO81_005053 [Engystomops pustulosus]|uniref:Uncharacterized protein n=1 Tax=Engystomops pustulosus TaxID=76066 RepID=A0AAV7CLS5_ENGPU|nr:hypothetical protein GDO81_005053 [Engystomops pustulosus]
MANWNYSHISQTWPFYTKAPDTTQLTPRHYPSKSHLEIHLFEQVTTKLHQRTALHEGDTNVYVVWEVV